MPLLQACSRSPTSLCRRRRVPARTVQPAVAGRAARRRAPPTGGRAVDAARVHGGDDAAAVRRAAPGAWIYLCGGGAHNAPCDGPRSRLLRNSASQARARWDSTRTTSRRRHSPGSRTARSPGRPRRCRGHRRARPADPRGGSIDERAGPADPQHYINRELSFLEFNQRVLDAGLDRRCRCWSGSSSCASPAGNLDEFFEIRVAGLKAAGGAGRGAVRPRTACRCRNSWRRSHERARAWSTEQYRCLNEMLMPELARARHRVLSAATLDADAQAPGWRYFSARSSRC